MRKLTYQAQIKERFLNAFRVTTTLTNKLLLEQALKYSRYETLPLGAEADVFIVLKRGLYEVLQQEQKEFLCITLLTHVELW